MSICEKLSRYRTVLMGLAILWVMYYHSKILFAFLPLRILRETGYGGVDLFMLLSGFGAWTSLRRDPDPLRYYKRRAKRILPSYWAFLAFWFLWRLFIQNLTAHEVLGNVLMAGWTLGFSGQFNWYPDALALFYLAAPLAFIWMERRGSRLGPVLLFAGVWCAAVALCVHHHLLIAVTRIPMFFLGMCAGRALTEKRPVPRRAALLLLPAAAVGLLLLREMFRQSTTLRWSYGLWWYPMLFLAPVIAYVLLQLCSFLDRWKGTRWVLRPAALLGRYSLEIFLWHLGIFEVAKYYELEGRKLWLLLSALSIVYGCAFGWTVRILRDKVAAWLEQRRKSCTVT